MAQSVNFHARVRVLMPAQTKLRINKRFDEPPLRLSLRLKLARAFDCTNLVAEIVDGELRINIRRRIGYRLRNNFVERRISVRQLFGPRDRPGEHVQPNPTDVSKPLSTHPSNFPQHL